ncbi:MAG: tRNA (guanosine(46)-N7)-methyltransferase TrmB [Gammaproteobacteria bacterium]|nr:tRNA (guanosine(46)-N7)-methyltransferase TrmB [Gammaproteobacteria bacterium]
MSDNRATGRIRSYVLRQGRLTSGQAHALKNYWSKFGIDHQVPPLDLDKEFERRAPRTIDIGVGMGDTSLKMASCFPENDYLAIDVHQPGTGSLLRQIEEKHLRNIRVMCHDVVEILSGQIPNQSFDQAFIFFPDPWPKKRHHKRRLINNSFLNLLVPKLKENGCVHIATDWQELAEHMMAVCDSYSGLINMAGAGHFSPRPHWRPLTKFEKRGTNLSHQVFDLSYFLNSKAIPEKS